MTDPARISRRRLILSLVAGLAAAPGRSQSTTPDFTPEFLAARQLALRIRPVWLNALIAAEDPGFLDHPVAASGLTAQAARLLLQSATPGLSAGRLKVRAMGLTILLGARSSRDEVLCLVLLLAPFGRGAKGHDSAARVFFRKGADELDLAQVAFLAGRIKNPSNGPSGDANALKRKDDILREMHRLGMIDAAALTRALAEPLSLPR